MKLKSKLKLLAASVALGLAAHAGAAPVPGGTTGNGGLFVSFWDGTGSYTRNLGITIDQFESQVAAGGAIDLSWTADSTFAGWIGSHQNAVWHIAAIDGLGARRMLTTAPQGQALTPTSSATSVRTAIANVDAPWLNQVNNALASVDSATFLNTDPAWAGNVGATYFGSFNFASVGTLATNSYAGGLDFFKVNGPATGNGTPASLNYNRLADEGSDIRAYLDGSNTLYLQAVAAVPEPETYGMLAAGLLMLGAVARRRRQS